MRRLTLFATLVGACTVLAFMASTAVARTSSSGGSATAVYNSVPSNLPGSVASEGFQCCGTSEFGDQVILGGPARKLSSMSVVMVSWACQEGHWTGSSCTSEPGASFNVPLTFTIYDSAEEVVAESTQTVNIRYRPASNFDKCGDSRWYDKRDHQCYNGYAQKVTMTFAGDPVVLPDDVFWSVAFNTTTYGEIPVGPQPCNADPAGCPYDSLNVGTKSFPNAPYVGTDVNESQVYRNGSLEGGWTGYRPLGTIRASK